MSNLVSILIPAYNAGKWIGDTITSALNQTWPHKEIIIVDDGSTDHTLAIARQFESRFVKVITQENRGASAARNRALALAQGDYIQWLDADDLLAPDKISKQLRDFGPGTERILISGAWGKFFFTTRRARFTPTTVWEDLDPVEWIIRRFVGSAWMQPAAWLVSRKLANLAGPWNEQLSFDDDGEYFCRVVSQSEKVKFVREARSYYRVGNFESLSSTRSKKALESSILSIRFCIGYLLSLEDSKRTRNASLQFLQNRFSDFYPENIQIIERLSAIATELGGPAISPNESRKFLFLRKLFGLSPAKRIRALVWKGAISAQRNWDRLMLHVLGNGESRW